MLCEKYKIKINLPKTINQHEFNLELTEKKQEKIRLTLPTEKLMWTNKKNPELKRNKTRLLMNKKSVPIN